MMGRTRRDRRRERDAVGPAAGPGGRGLRRARRAAVVLLALAGLLTAPRDGVAQAVSGTVIDAQAATPLPGVLVSLLDYEGRRVDATLTDESGRFAFAVDRFGRFRLRAERIGLETSTSASFDLFGDRNHEERIPMGQRAIQIEGLVVDSRVEQCRLDPESAVVIQRWWQEVRTALDVSSVVQDEGLVRFRVERFERAWDRGLSVVVDAAHTTEMGLSGQPFVSAEADHLARDGFIQGELGGIRDFYAPDADVLLSDVFLARHCFSLRSHDEDHLLGLAFEPVLDDVPDISGTLWVDTTTAELQALDFRYVDVDEVPENRSGGHVSFDVLDSGAWVVREWYIRMPSLRQRGSDDIEVMGYVDVGAMAVPMDDVVAASPAQGGGVGAIRGVVWDSVAGQGLDGATVSIVGTDLTAVSDGAGEFVLPRVPAGAHRLTFTHPELQAWGLGSPLVLAEVKSRLSTDVRLAIPSFRRVAGALCRGGGLRSRGILLGDVVDPDGVGVPGASLILTGPRDGAEDAAAPGRREVRVDPDGYFVVCLPFADVTLSVDIRVDGSLLRGFDVTVPEEAVVYRRIQLPASS